MKNTVLCMLLLFFALLSCKDNAASKDMEVATTSDEDEMYSFRIIFGNADLDSLVLYVPRDAVQKYKKAYGWRIFKNIVSL